MSEATLEIETKETESEAEKPAVAQSEFKRKPIGAWVWLVMAVIAMAIAVGVWFLLDRRSRTAARQQPVADSQTSSSFATLSPEQRAAITVEIAQKRMLEGDVTAPGKIAFNGNRVTPVFSQFSGRIVRLVAEIGTTVRSGQTIGLIDTPDIVGMQSDYLQALTTERSARTTLDLATRTRERAVRLAEAEAIPKRDLQQAQADESRAADDLQRAQSAIAAARGRLRSAGMSEDEINRLAATSHSVNRIVALIAPITGTITDRKAGLGQVVQAGSGDPLFMIADLSSVWVNADVYEDQLAHIHAGAQVKIRTPAYPNQTFDARVDQIGSTVDPDKHTIAVRCVVANSRGQLKPGMFAAVVLRAAGTETATTVPSSAVVVEGDRRSVFVEESPGQYVKRLVETGSEVDGSVVIRSGLKEGERVVVRGGLLMSAGPGQ
jgi:cobalt-zinc-cadmium efflux system membrane fusion protein